MDAVEYLKERARMCKQPLCDQCEFNGTGYAQCFGYENMYPKECVSIVEQWSREHPVMTNAQKFEEVFGYFAPVQGRPYMPSTWWNEPYKGTEGKE